MVTGKHLAELCYENFHPVPNFLLWLMVEIAIIGSDMQEVIGTAIAIFMLSNQAVSTLAATSLQIPLWAGCLITLLDTFTFLFLDSYGRRKLEVVNYVTSPYDFFSSYSLPFLLQQWQFLLESTTAPTSRTRSIFCSSNKLLMQAAVASGTVVPWLGNSDALMQAVAAVGAIIMPHNLYLHSGLVSQTKVPSHLEHV